MERDDKSAITSSWMTSAFTDIHFWVPVAVLIGGLLLLKFIH